MPSRTMCDEEQPMGSEQKGYLYFFVRKDSPLGLAEANVAIKNRPHHRRIEFERYAYYQYIK